MKFSVLSDIHGNIPNLNKAKKISKKEKVSFYICCGDIQTKEVIEEFGKWEKPVYIAWGNVDKNLERRYEEETLPENIKSFDIGTLRKKKKNIAFVHFDWLAYELAKSGKYNIVFYGHTHTPWIKKIKDTIIINPGEISGQFGKSTFTVYDLDKDKPELKIL